MIARCIGLMVIAAAGLTCLPSIASEASSGKARNLASACAMCHGTNGVSLGGVTSIAGQSREYLEMQLRDFRAGKRPATIMQQIAKGYSDQELAMLASYFAAQASVQSGAVVPPGKTP